MFFRFQINFVINLWGGCPHDFSVSLSPLGTNWVGVGRRSFGNKGLGTGLDNKILAKGGPFYFEFGNL